MTEEEKQLLLIDLCARESYGHIRCKRIVKSFNPDTFDEELEINEERIAFIDPNTNNVHLCGKNIPVDIGEIKPYLRPMSSMTKEEKKEYFNFILIDESEKSLKGAVILTEWAKNIKTSDMFDWLNKKGFDYRGLIPMGLASEEKNIN